MQLIDVRLNGSAASYVVSEPKLLVKEDLYNDVDFLFLLDEQQTEKDVHTLFECIRDAFFRCLCNFLPEDFSVGCKSHFVNVTHWQLISTVCRDTSIRCSKCPTSMPTMFLPRIHGR